MGVWGRSMGTVGIAAATATAIWAAPAVVAPQDVRVPAVTQADVALSNTASDISSAVYSVSRYWANYVSLELGPWAIGFLPGGYLINDQIFIWYPGGWSPGYVLPMTDTYVNQWLNPVLNDPLNPAVWAAGFNAQWNTSWNGLIGSLGNEVTYALSLAWLPFPVPPLPFAAAAPAGKASLELASDITPAGQALIAAADKLAARSDAIWKTWEPFRNRIDTQVGDLTKVLSTAGPVGKVAAFELNETWDLVATEGNAVTGFPRDLIKAGDDFVRAAVVTGVGEATKDAAQATTQAVVNNGGLAVNGVTTYVKDHLKQLGANTPALQRGAKLTDGTDAPQRKLADAPRKLAKSVTKQVQKVTQSVQKAVSGDVGGNKATKKVDAKKSE